jgi:hypothetical protein
MEVAYASTVSVKSCIHFPGHNIRLTAVTSAPLERAWNTGLERTWTFAFSFYFYAMSALEEYICIMESRLEVHIDC